MFLQAGDFAAPGAEPIPGSLLPGGRVDSKDAETLIDNHLSVPEITLFLKGSALFYNAINALFTYV
jgi:hypothetical protein